MGLGTGLNTYLAYVFSKENNVNINYHSIEKFPLTEAEIHLLEMKSTLPHAEHADFYQLLHSCLWEKAIGQDGFLFSKSKIDFLELDISQKFDVIFYNMNYYMCKAGIEEQRVANKVCANLKK